MTLFQDDTRFNMSAGVGISVGNVDQRTNQPRIETSAQWSLADTVVGKLAGSYDQQLGRFFGKGVERPGEEWQTVALGILDKHWLV